MQNSKSWEKNAEFDYGRKFMLKFCWYLEETTRIFIEVFGTFWRICMIDISRSGELQFRKRSERTAAPHGRTSNRKIEANHVVQPRWPI